MTVQERYLLEHKAVDELFDNLNRLFFESALSKCVISLSPDWKARTYGHCTCEKVWRSVGLEAYEINLSANFLDRSSMEVAVTLLHEMCHLYAREKGIKDCSRGSGYHNVRYKEIAEGHGLLVEKDEKYGWSSTTLTEGSRVKVEPYLLSLP